MRNLLVLTILGVSGNVSAQSFQELLDYQLTKKDISYLGISKITIASVGYNNHTMEFYYDDFGDDTAYYLDGKLISRTIYKKDNLGRVKSRIVYSAGENSNEVLYTYEPNGAFQIGEYLYYDSTGNISYIYYGDGGAQLFNYDSTGRLTSIDGQRGLCYPNVFRSEIAYIRNKIIDHICIEMPSFRSRTFISDIIYGPKRLPVKAKNTEMFFEKEEVTQVEYSYGFKK